MRFSSKKYYSLGAAAERLSVTFGEEITVHDLLTYIADSALVASVFVDELLAIPSFYMPAEPPAYAVLDLELVHGELLETISGPVELVDAASFALGLIVGKSKGVSKVSTSACEWFPVYCPEINHCHLRPISPSASELFVSAANLEKFIRQLEMDREALGPQESRKRINNLLMVALALAHYSEPWNGKQPYAFARAVIRHQKVKDLKLGLTDRIVAEALRDALAQL